MVQHASWLPEDRHTLEVTCDQIHRACVCRWDKTGEAFGGGRFWRLIERKKQCILHGADGEH